MPRSRRRARSASAQLLTPTASGPSRAYRSTNHRHSIAVFSAEVITDRPSMATLSSMNSMPFAAQVSASSALMGRDASEMSVSPAQNLAKPSPVPGPSTVIGDIRGDGRRTRHRRRSRSAPRSTSPTRRSTPRAPTGPRRRSQRSSARQCRPARRVRSLRWARRSRLGASVAAGPRRRRQSSSSLPQAASDETTADAANAALGSASRVGAPSGVRSRFVHGCRTEWFRSTIEP